MWGEGEPSLDGLRGLIKGTALLAAVSHDLRTPLTAMKAGISALRTTRGIPVADREELLVDVDHDAARLITSRPKSEAVVMTRNRPPWIRRRTTPCPKGDHAVGVSTTTSPVTQIADAAVEERRQQRRGITGVLRLEASTEPRQLRSRRLSRAPPSGTGAVGSRTRPRRYLALWCAA